MAVREHGVREVSKPEVDMSSAACDEGCWPPGVIDMLTLVSNHPLDLSTLGSLLFDENDLSLVWPDAKHPFDQHQWRETLSAYPRSKSYFVASDGELIGHAALLETDELGVLAVSYVFIRLDKRGRGFGRRLVRLLEAEAKKTPGVRALKLRVRTHNPRAAHVYKSCGFVKSEQEDTLVIMRKVLAR